MGELFALGPELDHSDLSFERSGARCPAAAQTELEGQSQIGDLRRQVDGKRREGFGEVPLREERGHGLLSSKRKKVAGRPAAAIQEMIGRETVHGPSRAR